MAMVDEQRNNDELTEAMADDLERLVNFKLKHVNQFVSLTSYEVKLNKSQIPCSKDYSTW